MKKILSAALCFTMLLCGCSSGESGSSADSLLIVDAGEAAISEDEAAWTTTASSSASRTASKPHSETREENTYVPSDTSVSSENEPSETVSQTSEATVTSPQAAQTSETAVTSPQAAQTAKSSADAPSSAASADEQTAGEPVEIEPDFSANSYRALNYSEVKAVWISYIELAELLTGKSAADFRKNISSAFDNCVSLGLNTVYIHARSHGDAYYKSVLYPWSKYVTGTLNSAPDFDPLQIVIEEAHARGLSVHAWINPLRACAASQIDSYGDYSVRRWAKSESTAGKYVVDVGGTYYLNPAYEPVIELIARGAAEIAANYDVDGVHIDDYFYPTTDASFDSAAYSSSGYSTISSFRFANCDKLVSAMYSAVKSANSTALFGVSCQGSIENNYNQMYADVKKWCGEAGYLDYIAPQIYYGFTNSSQPYEQCLSRWNDIAKSGGIPLIAGLSVSKIGLEDTWAGEGKYEWINDKEIISRQIAAAMECTAYGGTALYSYRSVFMPESAVKERVEAEIAAVKKLYSRNTAD